MSSAGTSVGIVGDRHADGEHSDDGDRGARDGEALPTVLPAVGGLNGRPRGGGDAGGGGGGTGGGGGGGGNDGATP